MKEWIEESKASGKGCCSSLSQTWQSSYPGFNNSCKLPYGNGIILLVARKDTKHSALKCPAECLLFASLLVLEVISIKTLIFFCSRATRYNPAFQKGKSLLLSSLGFNVNNKGLIQENGFDPSKSTFGSCTVGWEPTWCVVCAEILQPAALENS